MFSADFISHLRDFTQDLTSGVLILIHSPDAWVLVLACRMRVCTAKNPFQTP